MAQTTGQDHPHYRPDIDGLRAVAVLSVVAFHSFAEFVPGGFVGVDIFFVISGYLITSILLKQISSGSFTFREFYFRRARRIFPALILVLLTCFAIGKAVLFPDELQQLSKHIASGAGFVSNLVLWSESGYFDASAETKPLLHLWSLGIEEQFYIFWPMLIWGTVRFRQRPAVLCVLIAAASFTLNVSQVATAPVSTFYSPLSRCWELQIGSLLAFPSVSAHLRRWSVGRRSLLSLAGHCLIVAAVLVLNPRDEFPGWWALLPTCGAACIISAGSTALPNRLLLAAPILVGIGMISYPLYLWHWPLLSFAQIIEGARPTDTVRGLLVGLSFLLAWLTFRFLEQPIRTRHSDHRTAIWASAVCGLVLMVAATQYFYLVRPATDAAAFARAQIASQSHPWPFAANEACQKRFPFSETASYPWWFCMLSADKPPTIILLGNSQTNDFYPGFKEVFADDTILSIGTCDPAWVDREELAAPASSPCSGYRHRDQMTFINRIIETTPSLRLAVLGSLPVEMSADYINRLRRRISFIESRGIKVALFSPLAPLGYDIRSCFTRSSFKIQASCTTDALTYRKIAGNFSALATSIRRDHPHVVFFDTNFHCNDAECRFKLDGIPILRDKFGHISEFASSEMARRFAKEAPGL